jgi:hypothetical protein
MRLELFTRAFLKALLLVTILSGANMVVITPDLKLGISEASAKGYWTRKRVRGRWVNGRFPKVTREGRSHRFSRKGRRHHYVEPEDDEEVAVQVLPPKSPVKAPQPSGPAGVTSVHFDLKSRIKTTTYSDGRIDEQPFDPETIKRPPPLEADQYERLRLALQQKAKAMAETITPKK